MTLRTPVIEMGVSNGAAVRADDLCEPAAPLSLYSFLSFCLVLFLPTLFCWLCLSFLPPRNRMQRKGKKGKKQQRWSVRRGSNAGLI